MWRVPVWETFLSDKKTRKNPYGIYAGQLMTKGLFKTTSYKEAKEIVAWLNDVNFMCQHKIVKVDKIKEIIKQNKSFFPKNSMYYWRKYLHDDADLRKEKPKKVV